MTAWRDDPASVRPMLATTGTAPLESPDLAYEPKYDGIRAIASVTGDPPSVRFWSRLGNDKTAQFPEVAEALRRAGRLFGRDVLLDGEIVALDARGEPTGFQSLQGRIHLKSGPAPGGAQHDGPRIAFIVFDLLREGDEDLRRLPLRDRRARLERLMAPVSDPGFRISQQAIGDGRELQARAEQLGWEGLIAKRVDSLYRSGRRSPDWCKLKLVRHQTCVVGGWTEPRGTRPFFGALLLGLYDTRGQLIYVGHTGAGFSDAELGRVWRRLRALETRTCPFAETPRTNERPHWVRPEIVAEVKFTEWTADGRLRHPTYLGLRDDVKPEDVRKEPDTLATRHPAAKAANASAPDGRRRGRQPSGTARGSAGRAGDGRAGAAPARRARSRTGAGDSRQEAVSPQVVADLLDQLDAIQDRGGDGVLELPGGDRLEVSHLVKPYWPAPQGAGRNGALTKGDLFRHYVRVSPVLLPALADRPLVMKRYPNGIRARPFYQHRAPAKLPPGVRVETISTGTERRPHIVGGDLKTLLYTAQLASISQDPWFSRVGSEHAIDHVAIDLDPPEGLPFARVLDVARWVRDELEALHAPGFPKTSGSAGLHIYVPMPPETPYEAGLLYCQIVATLVARKHPALATVERAVRARGMRVYVDCLQNVLGKTLASAYSPRANEFAGVSTPLTWEEVDAGVSPRDFTIRTFAARLKAVGDLWAGLRTAQPADLEAAARIAAKATKSR